MSEVTNAQLLNAIKFLTKKVEALEAKLEEQKTGKTATGLQVVNDLVELPEDWKYGMITPAVATHVMKQRGLAQAAEALGMTPKKLTELLKNSGLPHPYGQKWSVTMKQAILGIEPVDEFVYPDKLVEKFDKVLELVREHGLSKVADKLEMPQSVVGRYLQKRGYDGKGQRL